jgi:hypothetical protein
MTCVAAMVVPFVVPSTRTPSPLVMAFAEVGFVPFWYVVVGAALTVTFWPADVVSAKPDVDTLSTVPDAPPADGPDRALDAAPPDPPPLPLAVALDGVVLDGVVFDADDDEPPQAASATTTITMPARTSIRAFVNRPRAGRRRTMESRSATAPERLARLYRCSTHLPGGVIVS